MEKILKAMHDQFQKMTKTGSLFRANISGDDIWNLYLSGVNNLAKFRDIDSNIYNCNYCHNFIRRYGNIVAIDANYQIMSLWDFAIDEEYENSRKLMSEAVHSCPIASRFVESKDFLNNPKTQQVYGKQDYKTNIILGCKYNTKVYSQEDVDRWPLSGIKKNDVKTFYHFYLKVPKEYCTSSSVASYIGETTRIKQVFERGMLEISLDTLELARDLEAQGSLLNGASYKHILINAIKWKKEYESIPVNLRDNWLWITSAKYGNATMFRNTVIGTLLVDLSEGMDLNEACKAFNLKVDPANYMKASAPITSKQIAEAQKFVEENGYEESFDRRCATLEDIKVSDILHSNVDADKVKTKVSIFDNIKRTSKQHKKATYDNVEEVSIDKFMSEILPTCTSVEVLLTNQIQDNLVTLITSANKDSKPIFKWDNNFSWTYNGNLAGKSEIKKAVKNAGGFVDAPFRFSIMWNDKDTPGIVDFDAHLREPNGDHIFYAAHKGDKTCNGGQLDIDMINPKGIGVENIFYTNFNSLEDGEYKCWVNNFNGNRNSGVKAEIYFNGHTWTFKAEGNIQGNIVFATVYIKNGYLDRIDVNEKFLTTSQPINIWGLNTQEFHKTNLICLSPNYWGPRGVGNKHYFFMLEGCHNDSEQITTFHNEFLNEDLRKHRKVMEVLSYQTTCPSAKKQLSGVGFNATVHNEIILRIGGSHKRIIKVKI